MKIRTEKRFQFDTLIEAEYKTDLYYIHVNSYAGKVDSISINRGLENVLIFDRKNFGWQIKPADKQTDHVFKATLKTLALTMPE